MPKRKPKPTTPRCKTRRCTRPQHARGLCQTCLRAAYRMIENGEATEAELVEGGHMAPAKKQRGLFRKAAAQ